MQQIVIKWPSVCDALYKKSLCIDEKFSHNTYVPEKLTRVPEKK